MTNVLSHTRRTALWPLGRRKKKPAEFEHVHLPDDGQEFLKSSMDMLIQDLDEVSGTERKEAAAHFLAGEETFRNLQYRDAARLYRASFEAFESLSALLARGVALMMVSELKKAAGVFEEGRNLSIQRASGRFEAAFGINLGQVCNDLGEPGRSREALEEARDLSAEIDQPALEAMALRHLGTTFLTQALYDDAVACCEEAIQISEDVGNGKSVGHVLCNKAVFLASRGNLNEAEEVFRQCLTLGRELKDPYVLGRVHTNVANLELIRGNAEAAALATEKALNIHRGIKYLHGEARSLGTLALLQISQGNRDVGDQSHKNAVKIDRRLGYRRGEIRELFTMARLHLQDAQVDQALQLLRSISELAKTIGHQRIQTETSVLIASILPDILTEERITLLEGYLETSPSADGSVLQIVVSNILAGAFAELGLFDNAIASCQRAVSESRKIGNLIEEARSLIALSCIQDAAGDNHLGAENVSIAQALLQSQLIEMDHFVGY